MKYLAYNLVLTCCAVKLFEYESEFPNVCGEYTYHGNPYIQGTTVPCDKYAHVAIQKGNIGIG